VAVPPTARRLGVPLLAVFLFLATAMGADAATLFQSPSRNIGCAIDARGVRCDIRERDWRPPPKPSRCPVDWGHGLTLGLRGRARFVCAGDTVLGAGRRLPYGRSIRRGRFRCTSRRRGMRCVNRRNGHGFHLSRERARRF
jgi:hypothetical protein